MGQCLRKLCSKSSEEDTLLYPEEPPSPVQEGEPVFFVSPNVGRPASELTEEEQVQIARRIGFIQQLPGGLYRHHAAKNRECAICMVEFILGEAVRFLPCMHLFHTACIDAWLMRSFACPSCLEAVDDTLLGTFHPSPL